MSSLFIRRYNVDQKEGNIAKQIIELQREDGTWGLFFHALSQPTKNKAITTEQALRRLWMLGFTVNDEPIRKTIEYMTSCLRGERKMDEYWEKTHNWELFTQLMLSTWIRIFEPDNELALNFAKRWAKIIEKTFENGIYNHDTYKIAYVHEFASKPNAPREIDFVDFYHIVLLQGVLSRETENRLLEYILSKPNGIYYVYSKSLSSLPEVFATKESSYYLAALELLSGYESARKKLGFAVDWLIANKDANDQWDFGSKANDGIYFPISDTWKKSENRKADCTKSVTAFLKKMRE